MSVIAHVQHLQDKHARLEANIHEESVRPLPDFGVINQLKIQKLHLKEEIARYQNDLLKQAS